MPTVGVRAGKASIAKGVTFTLRSSEAATAKLTLAAGKYAAAKRTGSTTGGQGHLEAVGQEAQDA